MTAQIDVLRTERASRAALDVGPVVEALRRSREITHNIRQDGRMRELPSSLAIADILQGLITSLFPSHLGPPGLDSGNIDLFVSNTLSTALARLTDQLCHGLRFQSGHLTTAEVRRLARDIAREFAGKLPDVRATLVSDLRAAQQREPSAGHLSEILICRRGSSAIIYHRLANGLHQLGARLVASMIADLAHATTGIDIHPGASIGPGFFISRGTSIVIGETVAIGANVCLHQGVTLGESEIPHDGDGARPPGARRHPVIEDNVVIYSGAAILGPITVGAGSVIHGNVRLTNSVPPGSRVRCPGFQQVGICGP